MSSLSQAPLEQCPRSNRSPTYLLTNLRDCITLTFTNTARGSEATWTFISEGRVLFFLPWRHTRGSSPALQFTLQTTRAHCAITRPPGNTLWIAHQYNTNSAATQELDLFIPSAPSWELSVQENRCGERRVIYRACSEDQMPFISPLHQQLQTFSGEGQKDDLGSRLVSSNHSMSRKCFHGSYHPFLLLSYASWDIRSAPDLDRLPSCK